MGRNSEQVYRPYHALMLSDDECEDDDVCVWKDEPIFSDLGLSDEEPEPSVLQVRKKTVEPTSKSNHHTHTKAEDSESMKPPSEDIAKARARWTEGWAEHGEPSKIDTSEAMKPQTKAAETSARPSPRRTESQTRHAEPPSMPTKEAKARMKVPDTRKSTTDPRPGLPMGESFRERVANLPRDPRTADIPDAHAGTLSNDPHRERQIQYAFSTTRRNLTHISQFLLKLEARAGKATKEGIRNTLDATVNDTNYDLSAPPDYGSEIEELKHMSNNIYMRLYLIDRHWRRIARNNVPTPTARRATTTMTTTATATATATTTKHPEAKVKNAPKITILSEPDIKEWMRTELRSNHLMTEETCYFSVRDLKSNRSFTDWMGYLRELCRFGNHPHDEGKLVELAWLFLDRNLRGPRPSNPTTADQFIADLDNKRRRGVWAAVLENPKKQEQDDLEAWLTMRRYWSARVAPA
ncbi:hypothetical protein GGR50DRAFT_588498 [Xylaria sp. CBS 124048]|nr:hypothetical protein GGR50DRAFT_588498 [Xylaria sp. CBS 124048]